MRFFRLTVFYIHVKIYNSLEEINYNKNRIISVGSFDGIHKGHKEILNLLSEEAAKSEMSSLLITFYPHPQVVIQNPNKDSIRILTDKNEKIRILASLGIDEVLFIPFTKDFSMMSPSDFIKDLLFDKIGFSKIIIGYDHLFGNERSGDYNQLLNFGKDLGFSIQRIAALEADNIVISSTSIRKMLSENRLQEANYMLGHRYEVSGKVVAGQKLGRTIGFPTANVLPPNPNKLLPGNGVYLVGVIIGNEKFYGMANIGTRPTVSSDGSPLLEVNIFDFDKDIYEQTIRVEFYRYIREEEKFDSLDKLKAQIEKDKTNCKNLIQMFL